MKQYSDSGDSIVVETIGNSRLNGRHRAISKPAAVKQTSHMGMRCGEQENPASLMGVKITHKRCILSLCLIKPTSTSQSSSQLQP